MSQVSREFSGKTVDQAIAQGLAELGLSRDQVTIEIVHEGSRGILGLGGEEARVRLTPIVSEPPKQAPNETATLAYKMLETLLRYMGIQARLTVLPDATSDSPNAIILNILGDDLGMLIGRRGETLRDLEYVLRLMVAQKIGKPAKLAVDVEGYRMRRERVLRELAKRMAERVTASRQPITLEAMPPNERRIIHLTLRDHPYVRTNSIGEGEHRRVMILHKEVSPGE